VEYTLLMTGDSEVTELKEGGREGKVSFHAFSCYFKDRKPSSPPSLPPSLPPALPPCIPEVVVENGLANNVQGDGTEESFWWKRREGGREGGREG
jgi:hypothetical protein